MELVILKCSSCGKEYIPNKYTCSSCLSNNLKEECKSGIGYIHSYTTVSIAPAAFSKDVPYDVILVELENGLRVTARLAEGVAEIGRRVELVKFDESVYWFKSVEEGKIIATS